MTFFDNSDVQLSVAAAFALGEVGRATSLPLPVEGDADVTQKSIVETLLKKVKADNTHGKVRRAFDTVFDHETKTTYCKC